MEHPQLCLKSLVLGTLLKLLSSAVRPDMSLVKTLNKTNTCTPGTQQRARIRDQRWIRDPQLRDREGRQILSLRRIEICGEERSRCAAHRGARGFEMWRCLRGFSSGLGFTTTRGWAAGGFGCMTKRDLG